MNQLPPQLRFIRRPRTTPAVDGRPPRVALSRPNGGPTRSLPRARRLTQPLPLIGITLVLVAALGYLLVAASKPRTSQVVVAARYLPAGTRLRQGDLRLVELSAGQTLLGRLIPASAEASLLGWRLTAPALAGLPLGRATVVAVGGGPAAFTLAVPDLHAVAGNLAPGDRVSVLATFTTSTGAATARVVARGLVVLAVGQPPAGIDPSSATIPVTVALPDPSVATQLALANSDAKIDLLRDGSNTTAAIPATGATGSAAGAAP